MKEIEVSAKIGTDGTPQTIKFPFAENLDELVDMMTVEGEDGSGEKVTFSHAKASMIVALQGKMRTLMDPEREGGPMTAAQLQEELAPGGKLKWRPGTREPGKSAAEKFKELAEKIDPELRRQLLAQLAAQSAGAGTAGNGGGQAAQATQTQAAAKTATAAKQPANQQRGGNQRR